MDVYAVIWWMEYEGEQMLGIFSDYVKAREYMLSNDSENLHIRKVKLDHVYADFAEIGEVM